MKLSQISVGMQVAVEPSADAIVYTVKEIVGFQVKLHYLAGDREVSGGWIDVGLCTKLSAKQVAYQQSKGK